MPLENECGVIAQTYYKLQGLHLLKAAREKFPLPRASPESTLRSIFQAVEIALINLTDLMKRATTNLEQDLLGAAAVKMSWAYGFHCILVRLSSMPHQLGIVFKNDAPRSLLCINESPSLYEYMDALKCFDISMLKLIKNSTLQIESALAEQSLDKFEFNLLHFARICNHQSTIWEKKLAKIYVPTQIPSYEIFVVSSSIHKAVYDTVLTSDSFFTQFRGLHQIPEILGEEVNAHIEEAIRDIQVNRLQQAIEHMNYSNILAEGILAAMLPMVSNLSTSDYHQIRENLGMTSGSHSICLHYHLFNNLYQQLWQELINYAVFHLERKDSEIDTKEIVREIDSKRFDDIQAWMMNLLFNECLKLRTSIEQWRELHLHLPRNNLGGDYTKSLIGSADAIKAARQMRDIAIEKDPMCPILEQRELLTRQMEENNTPLANYINSELSLDRQILTITGKITQQRFKNVQERSGFFVQQCPFSPSNLSRD